MTVEVVTPADGTLFATLSGIKRELGITSSDNDKVLSDLLSQASDFIVRYTNRDFAKATVKETIGSNGGFILTVSRTPIVSITSIVFDTNTTVDSSTYRIYDADAGLIWSDNPWQDTTAHYQNIVSQPSRWLMPKYEINYVGGYGMPDVCSDEERNLPFELERACLDIVRFWYKTKDRDPSLTSKQIDTARESYSTNIASTSAVPMSVQSILDFWRRT